MPVTAKRPSMRDDREPRAERQRLDRRLLDIGRGKHQRAQRRHLVRRLGAGRGQRIGRQPADIAVGSQAAPSTSLRRLSRRP